MTETICPSCRHPRRVHSKNGCEDWDPKTGPCKCKKKYMELGPRG